MPSSARFAQTPERMFTPFSPMPPVKTMHIDAAQFDEQAAQVPANLGDEHIEREPGPRLALGGGFFQVADVAADAARGPSRPDSLGQRVEHLVAATCPSACMISGIANGSKSPTRLLCGRPVCGLMPMLVATLLPAANRAQAVLPPRWHEMIRRSSRPSSWLVRWAM